MDEWVDRGEGIDSLLRSTRIRRDLQHVEPSTNPDWQAPLRLTRCRAEADTGSGRHVAGHELTSPIRERPDAARPPDRRT